VIEAFGRPVLALYPSLRTDMKAAGFREKPERFAGKAFLRALAVSLAVSLPFPFPLPVALFSLVFPFLLASGLLRPKLVLTRKVRDVEKNLPFAMRHILVQLRSGVPLFDSFVSVSKSDYGAVSEEFSRVVREAGSGKPLPSALDSMAARNPSPYLRRILWQFSNAVRSGSDVAAVLSEIVRNLSEDQRLSVRRYGSALNPMAMVYLLFSVVLPSLGISFLVILSMFSGVSPGGAFYLVLISVALFQVFFVSLIRIRRPVTGLE